MTVLLNIIALLLLFETFTLDLKSLKLKFEIRNNLALARKEAFFFLPLHLSRLFPRQCRTWVSINSCGITILWAWITFSLDPKKARCEERINNICWQNCLLRAVLNWVSENLNGSNYSGQSQKAQNSLLSNQNSKQLHVAGVLVDKDWGVQICRGPNLLWHRYKLLTVKQKSLHTFVQRKAKLSHMANNNKSGNHIMNQLEHKWKTYNKCQAQGDVRKPSHDWFLFCVWLFEKRNHCHWNSVVYPTQTIGVINEETSSLLRSLL